MIINEIWNVFSLPAPHNKQKNWYLLLQHTRYPLEYVKHHVKSLQKGSEAHQYVIYNLAWSGVYLRSTLSNNILQKVLTLVPLTSTGPDVFVTTTNIFISDSYDALEETLTHRNIRKLKNYTWENVTDYCDSILVDSERLESAGTFKPDHLG